MDTMELAQRAIAELAPLGDGLGLRAAMQAAENDALAPHMLSALLGHELVAGHATMIKLSTKVDRWLALVADDRAPADQERGSREAVRLAVAAARLSERYRVGLVSLAKLRGWEGFRKGSASAAGRGAEADDLAAAAEIAAALIGDGDGLDDGPHDDPNGGGPKGGARAAAKALQQLQALRGRYGNLPTNGHANGTTPHAPTPAAPANRSKLRHGNPSGDFLAAPRCGAQTRAACPCRQPAMSNGRCRMHGGKSTGARTASGLSRVRANRLVHGARTAEIIDLRSAAARHGRTLRTLARLAKAPANPQSERSTPCPATNPALVAASSKGTTGEHGCAQMNTDAMNARQRRATSQSAFIPSYLRSSVVNPSPTTAPNPRSERPSFARRAYSAEAAAKAGRGLREGGSTPCPTTPRRAAAG